VIRTKFENKKNNANQETINKLNFVLQYLTNILCALKNESDEEYQRRRYSKFR
jgi:hypothetical protein